MRNLPLKFNLYYIINIPSVYRVNINNLCSTDNATSAIALVSSNG